MRVGAPIRLLKAGTRLVVDSAEPAVVDLCRAALTYTRKEARTCPQTGAMRSVDSFDSTVMGRDIRGRPYTFFGYYELLSGKLGEAGLVPRLEDVAPEDAAKFVPDWSRLQACNFVPRHRQNEALEMIAGSPNGVIGCPPGWGKGTVIAMAAAALAKAKIAVVTKSINVLTQRLYPEIASSIPGVGLFYGATKRRGRRVTCYSTGCLGYAEFDEDLVFVDEGHQCATDLIVEQLARFTRARMFMFSASLDRRFDGGDFRLTGLFGPTRLFVPYQEAVEAGSVSPIQVHWTRVERWRDDPIEYDAVDRRYFKPIAYWDHAYRNWLIARDARLYGPDVQTLVYVHTIRHALALKRFLPEYEVVYSPKELGPALAQRAEALGLRSLSKDRYYELRDAFTDGRLRKAIATTCWNVGVDFRQLQVLVRADGGDSRTDDIQVPGRSSRISSGKSHAIIRDYHDAFSHRSAQRSLRRRAEYDVHGWESRGDVPGRPKPA